MDFDIAIITKLTVATAAKDAEPEHELGSVNHHAEDVEVAARLLLEEDGRERGQIAQRVNGDKQEGYAPDRPLGVYVPVVTQHAGAEERGGEDGHERRGPLQVAPLGRVQGKYKTQLDAAQHEGQWRDEDQALEPRPPAAVVLALDPGGQAEGREDLRLDLERNVKVLHDVVRPQRDPGSRPEEHHDGLQSRRVMPAVVDDNLGNQLSRQDW